MDERQFLDTDIAWAAGFLDGEGFFGLTVRKGSIGSYRVALSAPQIIVDPLEKLRNMFGGSIGYDNKSAQYRYQIQGEKATNAMKLVLPYLVVKNQQAILCISYQELLVLRHGTFPSVEEKEVRTRFYEMVRSLNHRSKKGVL